MPKGDGTGPPRGTTGRGGRMGGNRSGVGPGGNRVRPSRAKKAPPKQGAPCPNPKRPKRGTKKAKDLGVGRS